MGTDYEYICVTCIVNIILVRYVSRSLDYILYDERKKERKKD